jgi:hypothetical protein
LIYLSVFNKGLKNVNKILWSKSYAFLANGNGGLINILLPTEISMPYFYLKHKYKNKNVLWIKMGSKNKRNQYSFFDYFIDNILDKINYRFIIIASDGDTNIVEDILAEKLKYLNQSEYLVAFYCQNLSSNNSYHKFKPIPIGLDLHYDRGFGLGSSLYKKYKDIKKSNNRIKKVLVDCCVNKTSSQRVNLCKNFINNELFDVLVNPISQYELWEKYASYEYVLTMYGNGLDCHRTWEALGQGAKILAVGNLLSNLYDDLPVICINELDISFLTYEKLNEFSSKMTSKGSRNLQISVTTKTNKAIEIE